MGRWGAGEQRSRGAREQGRIVVQVLSPPPLRPSAPLPLHLFCPMPQNLRFF